MSIGPTGIRELLGRLVAETADARGEAADSVTDWIKSFDGTEATIVSRLLVWLALEEADDAALEAQLHALAELAEWDLVPDDVLHDLRQLSHADLHGSSVEHLEYLMSRLPDESRGWRTGRITDGLGPPRSSVAMIKKIQNPMAYAIVAWVPRDMGGRRSGPPSAPVYAATSVFVQEGDSQVHPEWPLGADQLSILIEQSYVLPGGTWHCKIDFLARELAEPFIHPGAVLLIMEGPKVVATAVVTSV